MCVCLSVCVYVCAFVCLCISVCLSACLQKYNWLREVFLPVRMPVLSKLTWDWSLCLTFCLMELFCSLKGDSQVASLDVMYMRYSRVQLSQALVIVVWLGVSRLREFSNVRKLPFIFPLWKQVHVTTSIHLAVLINLIEELGKSKNWIPVFRHWWSKGTSHRIGWAILFLVVRMLWST